MHGAQIIAQSLKKEGVKCWFGMPGGHDELYLAVNDIGISSYLVHDEKNGALMADGYSRSSSDRECAPAGQMAVPNMVAGMTEAFMSSIPLVAIAAQHDESILERNPHGGFVDHVSLLRTCTKWTHLLKKSDSIPEVFSKAFRYATSGRPGPVAIIAPSDIMGEEVISGLEKSTRAMANYSARFAPPAEGITAAVRLLIGADRPIIIAGGGVLLSQAWPELIEVG